MRIPDTWIGFVICMAFAAFILWAIDKRGEQKQRRRGDSKEA